MRMPTRLSRTLLTALVLSSLGLLAAPLLLTRRDAPAPKAADAEASRERARETYGRVPLGFEANRGQTDPSVDFLARGAGYALFLKPAEAVFVLQNSNPGTREEESAGRPPSTDALLKPEALHSKSNQQSAVSNQQSKVLRMRLVGADASAAAEGVDELTGKANYLVGDDASRWQTDVPTFGRVRYADVYEGVDVVYYGNQRQLEYDFVVASGRDPRAVSLSFDGADKVEVDERGDLLLSLGETLVRQPKPFVYQEVAGARRAVEAGYAVGADGLVGFAVGEYDRGLPLVIDPTLVYSTYLGGSGFDRAFGVAVDSTGNAYVVGTTQSADFPTPNAAQTSRGAVFVTKLNAAGSALVYSTFLGGVGLHGGNAIAVDSAGNAYVTGWTLSPDFPTANALQGTMKGYTDAFVTKLNPAGSALVYSTFLGGSGSDSAYSVAVDSAGNAYVTGDTSSPDFPTANALQPTCGCGGYSDVFIAKLNPAGTALVYSTFLGGYGIDWAADIAVDSAGNAYVTGRGGFDFPTANALQGTRKGFSDDAFVTKLNPAGSALVYSTFLGGSGSDSAYSVAVDSAGNAYVTGGTDSPDFPTANALQGTMKGYTDAFVTKLNPAGSALVYSTFLGGDPFDVGRGIAVDSAGNAYVTGHTSSPDFPTTNALQCTGGRPNNVFATKLNAAGAALVYSTYLGGGDGDDFGIDIAVDSAGDAYLVGFAPSTTFPVAGAIQGASGDNPMSSNGFVAKIGDTSALPATQLELAPVWTAVEENVNSVTLTVRRTGDTTQAVTVDYATFGRGLETFASERSDHTTAVGTLRFAAGETEKTFSVLVNEDSFDEGNEFLPVLLLNPTGGATLSCPTAVTIIQIGYDGPEPSTNAIDDQTVFVGTHYHDFLNRQADPAGLNFWTAPLTACGTDEACLDRKRADVSTAFFLSIEFQQTGFYVFRFYKASFTGSPAHPRGMPRYREFLRDTQEIGRSVVVNQGNWEQVLEANKQEFARHWVQRTEFINEFPMGMSADDYVNKLFANSGVTPTPAESDAVSEVYADTVEGRATALRRVVESGSVYNRQFNPGFVLAQYIGYLRRNPNDAPDGGYTGFDYWLAKLDSFSLPGEDVRDEQTAIARVNRAEMVRAFIRSAEYRRRFGQ